VDKNNFLRDVTEHSEGHIHPGQCKHCMVEIAGNIPTEMLYRLCIECHGKWLELQQNEAKVKIALKPL
jgi:hypothetical protein